MRATTLVLFLAALCIPMLGLFNGPAQTSSSNDSCLLQPGEICFHTFTTTDLAASTADSDIYEVSNCGRVSYDVDGDGASEVFIKQSSNNAKSGSRVFTDDMDNDGDVDAADEAITLNGTAGRRGLRGVPISTRWHWVDVQTIPSAGTTVVSVACF